MYIKVNGIKIFYEKSGQGQPIILLHGNGESHEIFDVLIGKLKKNFTVYAVDSRGHGKSSKVVVYDYNSMMEDIAAMIKKLKLEKPILYGFSDGGIVGIMLAAKYPKALSKLIISGANLNPHGMKARCFISMMLKYVIDKDAKIKMMLIGPHISKIQLRRITVHSFVLAGSKDVIKGKHTKYIAENIPNCILKIIVGEDHGSYIINSKKLYNIIKPFIQETETV